MCSVLCSVSLQSRGEFWRSTSGEQQTVMEEGPLAQLDYTSSTAGLYLKHSWTLPLTQLELHM